jgi:microcystin-dependent protein
MPATNGSTLNRISVTLTELVPTGTVFEYAGSITPSGWLLCYGQAVSRSTYQALYNNIGTTYGVGDGLTTFNLPDLRGRTIAGRDNMGGVAANRITPAGSGITGTTLGAAGGGEAVTLTGSQSGQKAASIVSTGQSASHTHPYTILSIGGAGSSVAGGGSWYQNAATTGNASNDHTHTLNIPDSSAAQSHSSTQPTIIMNCIIKY